MVRLSFPKEYKKDVMQLLRFYILDESWTYQRRFAEENWRLQSDLDYRRPYWSRKQNVGCPFGHLHL